MSQILSTGHLYLIAIDGKLDPSIFKHASRRKTFDINIIAINAAIKYARRRATGIGNLILLLLSTGRRRNESAGQSGEGKRPRAMFVPFFVFIGYAKYDGAARRIFHFEFRAVPSKIDLTRFARNNISVAGLHHTLCVEIVLRTFASLFIVIILHIRIDELWQFSHVFSIAHLIEFQPSVARERRNGVEDVECTIRSFYEFADSAIIDARLTARPATNVSIAVAIKIVVHNTLGCFGNLC